MELKMEIGLDQLIQAIKQLPARQFAKLKAEINNTVPEKTDKEAFKAFLLQAPVFTHEQINLIEEARKSMNRWGKN
ncbi:MAG TPA: hypothetical protein VHB48_08250 [Chitinophagaceae bacterium]|nr:hypothetical protein [Chitinophagaceae bacterium]